MRNFNKNIMKVLWLSNSAFVSEKTKVTGSWLQPMAEQIASFITLVNITNGIVEKPILGNFKKIKQWIIPTKASNYGQDASVETCSIVKDIIEKEKPDLVHIWGTENFWASIYRKGCIDVPTFLDVQGLLAPYTEYYYGGMSIKEIFQSIHMKEILMPSRTLFHKKEVFRRRGVAETANIKVFKHIAYQSQWVKNYLLFVNPKAKLYPTRIMLRSSFYDSVQWKYREVDDAPVVFSTCSAAVSYKGMHIIIKSISLLKEKYPNIKLKLAGNINVGQRLLDGYSVFLNSLVEKYNLKSNVIYLGALNENQIIEQLQNSNVCVIPSFIETYCLAFAESMIVGTPTIASFAGAMPELAENGREALFYNSVDYYACAGLIDRVLQDKELAESLSKNGRLRRMKENDKDACVKTQLEIYKEVLSNEHNQSNI